MIFGCHLDGRRVAAIDDRLHVHEALEHDVGIGNQRPHVGIQDADIQGRRAVLILGAERIGNRGAGDAGQGEHHPRCHYALGLFDLRDAQEFAAASP
ncbi:MAG: hypothetical protein IIC09_04730 [Proteobacteria bacterium]|nr:hypothetical protein [Pseudomonadota bacterium]